MADNEVQWTKHLDADPDSPEAFMGNVLASMAVYVASQERQNISRRTRAGLGAARAKGVEMGQPQRLTGALLDRLTHHVHILEMNGESYRLKHSRENLSCKHLFISKKNRSHRQLPLFLLL